MTTHRTRLDQHIGTWDATPTHERISVPSWIDPTAPNIQVTDRAGTLHYRQHIGHVDGGIELGIAGSLEFHQARIAVTSDVHVQLDGLDARFRHEPARIDVNGLTLTPAAALDLADALQRAVTVAAGSGSLIQWHAAMADDAERADPDGELDPQDDVCPACGSSYLPGTLPGGLRCSAPWHAAEVARRAALEADRAVDAGLFNAAAIPTHPDGSTDWPKFAGQLLGARAARSCPACHSPGLPRRDGRGNVCADPWHQPCGHRAGVTRAPDGTTTCNHCGATIGYDILGIRRPETSPEAGIERIATDVKVTAELDADRGPFHVTVNTDPPKPPYGSPERAAYDAEVAAEIDAAEEARDGNRG